TPGELITRRGGRKWMSERRTWLATRDVGVLLSDWRHEGTGDEAELITAAQTDPLAFSALYRRYLPRVYRYLRAHAPSLQDPADLTQHVFLQALDALPGYQPRGVPFTAWLFRIARHAAIDAARRRRPALDWDSLPEALHPADEQGPEAEVLRREALA